MSTTPREFDHGGAVITDAAGGAYPWIRTVSGLWARQGLDRPLTWEALLGWHQDAIDDPADETTTMPTFVLLVPQAAAVEDATTHALGEVAVLMGRDLGELILAEHPDDPHDPICRAKGFINAALSLDVASGQAPATEDEAAESFAAELITMSVLGPDKGCDGDHEDGCCELDADRLPDGHMRLTFLVTDGTRPNFGDYRLTRAS